MSDGISERKKKKIVQEGLRALRNKPGWDVQNFQGVDPMERLHELDQEVRSQKTYETSTECSACSDLRQKTQDETALCDEHLAAAMGF